MKIHEVWLFTNRNTVFFDEKGEQISDLQGTIAWQPVPSYGGYKVKVHGTLMRVIEDQPKIYIARWQDWRHEITIDEFCSLIGEGPWYWKQKQEAEDEI